MSFDAHDSTLSLFAFYACIKKTTKNCGNEIFTSNRLKTLILIHFSNIPKQRNKNLSGYIPFLIPYSNIIFQPG